MKKQISPKIFTEESAETPKHDDILLWLEKEKNLSNIIVSVVKDRFLPLSVPVYRFIKDGKELFFKKKQLDDDMDFVRMNYNDSYSTEKIKEILQKKKLEFDAKDFVYGHKFETKDIKTIEIVKFLERIPEKEIISNSYYIGSVDYFVKCECSIVLESRARNKQSIVDIQPHEDRIFFEFKPQIKSFSETLRQINVYRNYLKGAIPVVLTYTPSSDFAPIFKQNGIYYIQLSGDSK